MLTLKQLQDLGIPAETFPSNYDVPEQLRRDQEEHERWMQEEFGEDGRKG